jgi:phosphoglycolate phosphatase-like HAD superfamily hydrolase
MKAPEFSRPIDLRRVRHAVIDFDGTLSLLTGGWSDVMTDLYTQHLPMLPDEEAPRRREWARREILALNGRPSIHQMVRLAELIVQRGGSAEPADRYHGEFVHRLAEVVHQRRDAITNGLKSPEAMLVPGSREFLALLQAGGVELTLLSGSAHHVLKTETAILQIAEFFGERIIGPKGDALAFTKGSAFEALAAEHQWEPGEMLAIGDGIAEIEHARALEGVAIGIACRESEPERGLMDELKRELLLSCGADLVVPDFRPLLSLFREA